ncbi:MAG TPA: nickel pincer cofactor biosynthesis protein LarB [Anaerolineales bacterium]|nr:nickel pincer cofactor biosynthesis protein LarB [Anaerolineales bacterium]
MSSAEQRLTDLLEKVKNGSLPIEAALETLRTLPYEDIGYARLDHHRALRQGFPEVVFAQGKTPDQVANIMLHLSERNDRVLATRASPEIYQIVHQHIPDAVYHAMGRLIVINRATNSESAPGIVLASAGTADMPVAEEAAITAELMGNQVERLYDVGVAGLHRLLDKAEVLRKAHVIIVIAGMEGALASVVAGLVSVPVIAVPTSVGYGASFGGLAPLLTMLNSCAPGVAVVNIDNGYGAGHMASLINRQHTHAIQPTESHPPIIIQKGDDL